jgi:hypothetical protein
MPPSTAGSLSEPQQIGGRAEHRGATPVRTRSRRKSNMTDGLFADDSFSPMDFAFGVQYGLHE